ncbi:MAG: hypothetical protein ABI681_08375 [Gemmatimonadales bacterium]
MHRIAAAAALLVIVASCSPARQAQEHPLSSRTVLALDEIQAAKAPGWTAYELIAELRPQFLRSRGAMSLRNNARPVFAVVYVDNLSYGGLQSLKTLSAGPIQRIEYLSAVDATTRFGTDHAGGAILITTR